MANERDYMGGSLGGESLPGGAFERQAPMQHRPNPYMSLLGTAFAMTPPGAAIHGALQVGRALAPLGQSISHGLGPLGQSLSHALTPLAQSIRGGLLPIARTVGNVANWPDHNPVHFQYDGMLTGGTQGGTGTIYGTDPYTRKTIMNASPAGNYVGPGGGGPATSGYSGAYTNGGYTGSQAQNVSDWDNAYMTYGNFGNPNAAASLAANAGGGASSVISGTGGTLAKRKH